MIDPVRGRVRQHSAADLFTRAILLVVQANLFRTRYMSAMTRGVGALLATDVMILVAQDAGLVAGEFAFAPFGGDAMVLVG